MVKRLSKREKSLLNLETTKYMTPQNHSELYTSILNKTNASFEILNDVFSSMRIIQHAAEKPKPISNAKLLMKKISDSEMKKLLATYFRVYPTKNTDTLSKNSNNSFSFMKIKQKNLLALSIFMLNLSLSYLQQSFLSKEYLILKKRVEQITEDIQNIVISFEEKQVLEKEIESYKKLYDRPIPFNNTSSDNYQAICLFCYKEHSGSSLWDNIQNIKHTSHCPYLIDDIDEEQKILRWIRVIKHGNEIKQKIHKEILKNKNKSKKD